MYVNTLNMTRCVRQGVVLFVKARLLQDCYPNVLTPSRALLEMLRQFANSQSKK